MIRIYREKQDRKSSIYCQGQEWQVVARKGLKLQLSFVPYGWGTEFPDYGSLIVIAIYEKDPAEVKRLYENTAGRRWRPQELEVADALAGAYPEVSMAIWKKQSESLIAQTKPRAYEEAALFLGKLLRLYHKLGRRPEWQAYAVKLRSLHKAKRRFMETLAEVEKFSTVRKKNAPWTLGSTIRICWGSDFIPKQAVSMKPPLVHPLQHGNI